MHKKKILIIEDNPKVIANIQEILGTEYDIKFVQVPEAIDMMASFSPNLVVLDNDLKETDGFELYRKLHWLDSKIKTIMISGSSQVASAVSAAKMGVSDYLMKPLEVKRFSESVKKLLTEEEIKPSLIITQVPGSEWLNGINQRIKSLFKDIEGVLESCSDIILLGERGINKAVVAEIIHINGEKRRRKFVELDLSSFEREDTESYFWGTLQELLKEQKGELNNEEELCGTLFLSGFGRISDHFGKSVLKYLRERKEKLGERRIDKEIKVIISIEATSKLIALEKDKLIGNFITLDIPPLRQRKADIPVLVNSYIRKFSEKYSKSVSGISGDILELFMVYDWPGNYDELESLISFAVLNAEENIISIKNLPLDPKFILDTTIRKAISSNDLSLESLRIDFERQFFRVILEKSGWDDAKASQMLDIPKPVFSERVKELGIKADK